jgi:putative restriction endonuclease
MGEADLRLAALDWLSREVDRRGDVLPWALLAWGFDFKGERIPLVSQQGIFKPRSLDLPLSIRTSASGPYDDSFGPDGLLRYRYRGTDPNHPDNAGLRRAMRREVPLVYFHAVVAGRYLAVWPVFIVGDDPAALTFRVAVDDEGLLQRHRLAAEEGLFLHEDDTTSRREYITALVRRRLHQRSFRERVLRAYREQCALCRLRHEELLDAAHILPDREEGDPLIRNGLALCKLHHAAFDALFLTIRPDYLVEVRPDILRESDGPMLVHGLQGLQGRRIVLPRRPENRPDQGLLAARYERFSRAGLSGAV